MTQDAIDILVMRSLFWQKVRGEITLQQMQAEISKLMSRQGRLI